MIQDAKAKTVCLTEDMLESGHMAPVVLTSTKCSSQLHTTGKLLPLPSNRGLIVAKSQYGFFSSNDKSHAKLIRPRFLNHPTNRLVTIPTMLPLLHNAMCSSSTTHNQNLDEKHQKVCNLATLENGVLHIII